MNKTFDILYLLDIIVEYCTVILYKVKNLPIFIALMFTETLRL